MHGNVWEWCSDAYGNYPDGPLTDPTGIQQHNDIGSPSRVLRGGSWLYDPRNCRAAFRYETSPGDRYDSFGFRLALDF